MTAKKIDLLIVGTQKAGTSTLLEMLGQHPKVLRHVPGEFGFFIKDDEFAQGYDAVYSRYYPANGEASIRLAKNVGLLESPIALRRVHEHNPDVRIVVCLRDPVDRAYSAFWYMKSIGAERADRFEDVVELDVAERFPDNAFLRRSCDYLGKGMYHQHLTHLQTLFEKEQLLIVDFRDLKTNGPEVCNQVFEFVNLEPHDARDDIRNVSSKIRYVWVADFFGGHSTNVLKRLGSAWLPPAVRLRIRKLVSSWNSSDEPIPKLEPETRERLKVRFAADNALLQRDYGISF